MTRPQADMSAPILLAALAKRHTGDVFVPECKNGPSQTGAHRRLDAWTLLKTWSPVTTIGYEIKVSRSDWRRDAKLEQYAGLCHLLYVVAPKGIIEVSELPDGVGLLEAVGEQVRLLTRRRAARREIEFPVSLLLYVLMSRSTIHADRSADREGFDNRAWRVRTLREWAETKNDRRELHYALSQKIREQFAAQEREIERIAGRLCGLENIARRIHELGFDAATPMNEWQIRRRLESLTKVIHPGTITAIDRLMTDLDRVKVQLIDLISKPNETQEVAV